MTFRYRLSQCLRLRIAIPWAWIIFLFTYILSQPVKAKSDKDPLHVESLNAFQVRQGVESGAMRLFDLRLPLEYALGHIPGSIHVPSASLFDLNGFWKILITRNKEVKIVVYSVDSACPKLAKLLALYLSGNVGLTFFPGGYAEWKNSDYPTNTLAVPIP